MRELAIPDASLLYLVFVVIAISMVLHTINLIVLNKRLGFGDVMLLYRELHKKYFTPFKSALDPPDDRQRWCLSRFLRMSLYIFLPTLIIFPWLPFRFYFSIPVKGLVRRM